MSEGDLPMEQVRNEHKLWGKHKWRGKYFANEEKEGGYLRQKGKSDDGVADFLHASSDNTGASQQQVRPQPRVEATTQSKWQSTSQVSTPSAGMSLYPRQKPPRNKGLHVAFESAAPVIIGEGGDEADLPTISILRPQRLLKPGVHSHNQLIEQATESVQQLPRKDYSSGTVTQSVSSATKAPELASLPRRPTRVRDSRDTNGLQTRDLSAAQYDPKFPVSSRANAEHDPQRIAQGIGEDDSKEETRMAAAISRDSHVIVASPPSQQRIALSHDVADFEGQQGVSSLNLHSLEPVLPTGNSLTPTLSPHPTQRLTQSDYPFPSLSHGETTSPRFASPSTQCQIQSPDETLPKPGSEFRPSLRSIAKNLGDDALEDFGARVQRFYEVFRLGITAFSSLTDISIVQWIRTSAWWFLKGRQELESAVRGRPRSFDESSISNDKVLPRDLKQAYLDLAKAWWITKVIVPDHPDLKKYGDASTSSLVAIVSSFGNVELTEAIEVYLGIIASMRALSVSMKRNNKLPPDDFEIQALVSRVWIPYPTLSTSVQSLLSARDPKSLVDGRSHAIGTCFPIAVGDTKDHFSYGNMFVEASLDDGQDQIHLPCIITILRERSSWSLDFTMASQDGQVNILIQNDKNAGLTWEDVRWKTKMQVMQIALTGGFEIEVQFSEKDFKSIWGIRDYTQKILKGFQCGKTEKFVFETSTRSFQYFSPKGSQVFPTEPIKDCKMRVFEKTVAFMEGSGQRRVHDGHRLIVVTPPSVKTLSSMTHDLGKQTPILFSYLRGEEGAPAILLRSPKSSLDSSMVLTFYRSSERKVFHALLDGTSMTDNERCSPCMPLKSFSVLAKPAISEKPADGSSCIPSETLLVGFRWHQLRVLSKNRDEQDHGGLSVVRSENLRVWADCDIGTFVDRINLGIFNQRSL